MSVELGGCRLLAGACLPGYDKQTLTQMRMSAMRNFRRSEDADVRALLDGDRTGERLRASLGSWCRSHFPDDRVVRKAKYPST